MRSNAWLVLESLDVVVDDKDDIAVLKYGLFLTEQLVAFVSLMGGFSLVAILIPFCNIVDAISSQFQV